MPDYTLRERFEAGIEYAIKRVTILPLINWAERACSRDNTDAPTAKEFYREAKEFYRSKARIRTEKREQAKADNERRLFYCPTGLE